MKTRKQLTHKLEQLLRECEEAPNTKHNAVAIILIMCAFLVVNLLLGDSRELDTMVYAMLDYLVPRP